MNPIKKTLNNHWNKVEDTNPPINRLITILGYRDVLGAIDDLIWEIKDRIKP